MSYKKAPPHAGLGDGEVMPDGTDQHWHGLVAPTTATQSPQPDATVRGDANAVQFPEVDGTGLGVTSASASCSRANLALFPNEAATSAMLTGQVGKTRF